MSQQPSHQNVPQSQQANSPQQEAPPQVQIAQPTVRVMRLYKPCMHVIPTIPPTIESGVSKSANFAVSPFLLLPDSFGDIYSGELFSAYIAVVNGNQDSLFTDVTLSVRLQTTNATHDLLDCRPVKDLVSGEAKVLNPNEAVDVVVEHNLTELGTHTLRVSVQYSSRYFSETKTLRKFYRFNVLQPLMVLCNGNDVGDRTLIQCLITNTTKSPLFLEETEFVAAQLGAEVVLISAPADISKTQLDADHFNLNSLPLLLPEESYAVVFSISKVSGLSNQSLGCARIKWCSYMGEHGVVAGNDVTLSSPSPPPNQSQSQNTPIPGGNDVVQILCISSPSTVARGTEFPITIRIVNTTTKDIPLQLLCRDMVSLTSGASSDQMVTSPSSESLFVSKKEKSVESSSTRKPIGSQLFVTGASKCNIGIIEAGESKEIIVTVCAVDLGLQELRGVTVLDINTLREYTVKSLMKVMVVNDY